MYNQNVTLCWKFVWLVAQRQFNMKIWSESYFIIHHFKRNISGLFVFFFIWLVKFHSKTSSYMNECITNMMVVMQFPSASVKVKQRNMVIYLFSLNIQRFYWPYSTWFAAITGTHTPDDHKTVHMAEKKLCSFLQYDNKFTSFSLWMGKRISCAQKHFVVTEWLLSVLWAWSGLGKRIISNLKIGF